MKKHTLKRLLLGLLQHLLAMCIMLALATILFNSYLTVQTMDGLTTYALSPLNTEPEYEDSDLFREIFRTAVADITRLVVIKGQVETGGEFDSSKLIDVTEYAGRKGTGNNCPVTVVYELEDLIKWGKYGVEYTNRAMSMSEFVNYFGPAASPYNFALDQDGELVFIGFYDEAFSPEIKRYHSMAAGTAGAVTEGANGRSAEELAAVEEMMHLYTDEQLEDMAFSYILKAIPVDFVDVSREDDGSVTVYFPMLNGRYETADKEKRIVSYAGNWIEYMQLQSNIVDAIEGLSSSYTLYRNCNSLYQSNSNLKYVVRVVTDDGIMRTYTNREEMADLSDSQITEYFAEYRRYFIYYPDSLEFTGNTGLTEADIHRYLSEYDYAYPESTHIWVGVDTTYATPGDAFYSAHALFENIVPNINGILVTIGFLAGLWIIIAGYLTLTAGIMRDEAGNTACYLNRFDHVRTEIFILFCGAFGWAGYLGYRYLLTVADTIYENHVLQTAGVAGARTYEYGLFAAYGGMVSLVFCILWYSLIRRLKAGNLWEDSLVHWIMGSCRKAVGFVLTHHNAAVSTLLPYNVFLLVNLFGIWGCGRLWEHRLQALGLGCVLILLDGFVGMLMFKHNGEWLDIVDAIKRIRDGQVEFKLETDHFHGSNREIADAVNNIGDGIGKAVNTSMKDEQMKTDLITNVSHDIKTPLTSIINYVDLLKRLKIQEEPAKSYIDVLDGKSQRLKQLADDLVEASKLSSGNLELNMEKLNVVELMNQAVGELSERLEERGLQIFFDGGDRPAYILADSRRMWRVMENLFNNVYKYAMENTRVYVDVNVLEESGRNVVELSLKNISERQMNIKAADLTERFIRGDDSRTTEGSGLGLYITKNLVQAQKGEFDIRLDGDLFKAVMRFPEYEEETARE
ncbi:MAG: HAMP domain-containing histidine kinase [Clostridium sp.]|nr:HAMP domain-containing histidine kinase [Acetatifactor muris]MCM1527970.1 HAMP domain-containing histidine kinase [Bacteroides sp.]MCM1564236.1 HAMP domain-containing histidine kinase [Clostridium sp.]